MVVGSSNLVYSRLKDARAHPAGVFQIEQVLERKIRTSGIQDLVEVIALEKGIEIRRSEKS